MSLLEHLFIYLFVCQIFSYHLSEESKDAQMQTVLPQESNSTFVLFYFLVFIHNLIILSYNHIQYNH